MDVGAARATLFRGNIPRDGLGSRGRNVGSRDDAGRLPAVAHVRGAVTQLAVGAALIPLLRRMRREFECDGHFDKLTATLMWATYAAGAAAFIDALRGKPVAVAAAAAAAIPAAAGGVLVAAGMSAFDDASQVTGTRSGTLATDGVYRYSRNPQYTGIVLLAAAAAAAARSGRAAALTAVLATAYRWWVPVEERALQREFGERYREYMRSTPRWLGAGKR